MKAPPRPAPFLDRFLSKSAAVDAEQYRDSVLRDTEDLLNTRLSSPFGEPGEEPEAAYGLADLSVTGRTEGELMKLACSVRHCLEQYEPRLRDIRVEARPWDAASPDRLTVDIEAALTGLAGAAPLSLEIAVPVWSKAF